MKRTILNKIEIKKPLPAIYIRDLNLIALADLHLGYETAAAEEGLFIPKIQYKKIVEDIKKIIDDYRNVRLLINGDVKHEFSETSYHEYKEVSNFFDFAKKHFEDIVVVKGNHDTFIGRITKRYDIKTVERYSEKDFLFIHGHKHINLHDTKENYIITAHEHPSIALYSEIGVKEKMKCFLYGKVNERNILVLPAFGFFAQGSDVNNIPQKELLSPILREIDIDSLEVLGIVEETKLLHFPNLKILRD